MAGELGGTGVAGQAVQRWAGRTGSVHGAVHPVALWCLRPEETAHPGAAGTRSAMKTLRRTLLVLAPVAALGLLAAGIASAQPQAAKPPQSAEDADKAKADAEKRRQDEAAKAEAARKAEARKPKRDKSRDGKDPERELEEEEDI